MHGLVHAQAFDVWPPQDGDALAGHLFGIVQRGELDIFCFGGWVAALDKFAERESNPRYNDRPAFDAAMTVDSFFGRGHLDDCVDVEHLLLLDLAVDGDGPGARLEVLG